MSKIGIIISREYWSRVKKKSFIVMTLLAPLLFAALLIIPALVAKSSMDKVMKVMVVDDNDLFINKFDDTELTKYSYRSGNIEVIKKEALAEGYNAVLHILELSSAVRTNLYFEKEPSMNLSSRIESQMDKILFDKMLVDTFKIDPVKFQLLKEMTQTSIAPIKIDEDGTEKNSDSEMTKIIGMVFGMIVYMLIFLFASQVLRGVLEEKTNRIVEVLISSVKPIELMLGKIIGIAMVGLTQFLLWIIFTIVITVAVNFVGFADSKEIVEMASAQSEMTMMQSDVMPEISSSLFTEIRDFFPVSITELLLCLLFYFVIGYLTYSALFAAVGAAVDNEADSQQFVMPVTIPLLLTIMLLVPISTDPSGSLAVWMSMIPLTSPIAMMIRLPAGVPLYELIISMTISILFFMAVVWMAAKIYRTGILMYGKKISYSELFKWLKYKN